MRRHRGNLRYLAWVIQRVAANASLAIALLGLGSTAAHAGAPVFDPFAPNPLSGQDVGFWAAPALGDLDADGDLDLLAGEYFGAFRYFQNTGTAPAPAFLERTGTANPANGLSAIAVHSQPALVDLDGDGDLDLATGSAAGTFQYFENTGNAVNARFATTANPLAGLSIGGIGSSTPTFGDLDGDGDLDLVSGAYFAFHYFENTGSAENPLFIERTGSANPLSGFVGDASNQFWSPALGDADGDGDLDVVSGLRNGAFRYYENTGHAKLPVFVDRTAATNPLAGENVGAFFAKAALGDLDGDGDLDTIGGADSGGFLVLANQIGRFAVSPEIDALGLLLSPGSGVVGAGAPTVTADIDADGDLDLWGPECGFRRNTGSANFPQFVAESSLPGIPPICSRLIPIGDLDGDGDIDLWIDGVYYRNTGTASNPAFDHPRVSPLMPPGLPSFADLDGDGDLDAATVTEADGYPGTLDPIQYFENTGNIADPAFIERFGFQNRVNPFGNLLAFGVYVADIDGDEDFDVVTVNEYQGFTLENVGTRSAPDFQPQDASLDPFPNIGNGISGVANRGYALGDFDGDGDLDAFGAEVAPPLPPPLVASPYYLENGIIRPSPRYVGPIAAPFTGMDVGSFSSPAAGDFDADGDLDFVASESFSTGAVHYLENTGSARIPRIVERSGAANPFAGLNAGGTPRLAVADVDADGDLDLVSGENYSNPVHFFENTGSASNPQIVERINAANPFAAVIVPRSAPSFGDLDADGDLDLVVGEFSGEFRYYENTGDAKAPVYIQRTGAQNPLNGQRVSFDSFLSTPALGDVDRDGDLDLISGDEARGEFAYFQNTGTATVPIFIWYSANPLYGETVGLNSSPAVADLDADSDLDLVSGERNGGLQTFYLPEPSQGLLLSVGLALLRWLERVRGRSGRG